MAKFRYYHISWLLQKTKLLRVAIFSRDNVFNIVVVGISAVKLGLLLKILVLLNVVASIGLLGSAIVFFLPSGEYFQIPVRLSIFIY